MVKAYELAGGDPGSLASLNTASMVVEGNNVLSLNAIDGVILEKEKTKTGIRAKIVIKEGKKIEEPIHLCFGVLPKKGLQEIIMRIVAKKNSKASILAHCTFPNAVAVKHIMDAEVSIEENAHLSYDEVHFHGPYGGIEVVPKSRIKVDQGGRLKTSFALTTERVGKLDIDYDVAAQKDSLVEISTKVYGRKDDRIKIRERVALNGERARSVIRTRIAVRDEAVSEITSITEGNAAYARGHVDCTEIVQGNGSAKAIPIATVNNEKAKITHEAAIGCVNKKQLETLIAHGLNEDKAIDVIIKGMLK
jgi:Fe-S cluster assembly scaffold protein SufB